MHPLPVPGSHEYVMRTAGSVDQSVAPETTASGSQGRLIFQSPHGSRSGQSTASNTEELIIMFVNLEVTLFQRKDKETVRYPGRPGRTANLLKPM